MEREYVADLNHRMGAGILVMFSREECEAKQRYRDESAASVGMTQSGC